MKEAKALLRCSLSTIYGLCATGALRCYRNGANGRGVIRIPLSAIDAYLKDSQNRAPAPKQHLKHIRL